MPIDPITAISLGLTGIDMLSSGFQAQANQGTYNELVEGAGQIRDEQIDFLETDTALSRAGQDFTRTSTIDRAQLSYDDLVASTGLGYEESMSDLGFATQDLNISTEQQAGNIMQQKYGAYTKSGLARAGNIQSAFSGIESDLLNKYRSSIDKLSASRDFLTKRKDLTIGQAGASLELTKDQAERQRGLALQGIDLAEQRGLAGIEQEYQGRLTDAESIGPRTFLEGFFS